MNETELSRRRVADAVRRMAAHYGLWFAEAVHQLGLEPALEAEQQAGDKAMDILAARVARALGLPASDGPGGLLAGLSAGRLDALHDALAVSWLALDGVWFQAVEGLAPGDPQAGMGDAKRVNDSCWSRFAPLEARRIMALEDLGPGEGDAWDPVGALARVLELRLYARINQWEITDRSDTGLTFTMLRCRVQDARQRKGLTDYPCKSGGLVEYTTLARAVDPRIAATCLHCPPDPRPGGVDGPACSWRFEVRRA